MVDFLKHLLHQAIRRRPSRGSKRSPLEKHIAPRELLPVSQTVRLGSAYGGWILPADHKLTEASVCYLAGAGEDISFDCELARTFSCTVRIIDPTPKAVAHFNKLRDDVAASSAGPESFATLYKVGKNELEHITFLPVGLAGEDVDMCFYMPEDPTHVSCSAVNLQKTTDYFVAQCYRLKSLVEQQRDSRLDLLKMDIEGAEYQVIADIVAAGPLPNILLIEFDECHSPLDDGADQRIAENLALLSRAGMRCVAIEGSNATFVRQ